MVKNNKEERKIDLKVCVNLRGKCIYKMVDLVKVYFLELGSMVGCIGK